VRALSVPLKLMDQARALRHDKDLSNRLTDRAGDVEIATVILIRDHQYVGEDRMARRVREDPARPVDPVNLAGEMRVIAWPAAGYGVAAAAGPGGDEDEQA
jgi:hypothetical protein